MNQTKEKVEDNSPFNSIAKVPIEMKNLEITRENTTADSRGYSDSYIAFKDDQENSYMKIGYNGIIELVDNNTLIDTAHIPKCMFILI